MIQILILHYLKLMKIVQSKVGCFFWTGGCLTISCYLCTDFYGFETSCVEGPPSFIWTSLSFFLLVLVSSTAQPILKLSGFSE
jgi:hypothetical protein